jgi:hypothetical protein
MGCTVDADAGGVGQRFVSRVIGADAVPYDGVPLRPLAGQQNPDAVIP